MQKKLISLLFLGFIVLAVVALGQDLNLKAQDSNPEGSSADPFSAMTYNAGLAEGFVPYTKERAQVMGTHLARPENSADVLCLQEVWDPAHQQKLKNELSALYPYSHTIPALPSFNQPSAPACYLGNILGPGKVLTCTLKNCVVGRKNPTLAGCVVEHCRKSLEELKEARPGCAKALFSQVGKGLPAIMANALNPFKAPDEFAYGGEAGIMLFSKIPFVKTYTYDLASFSTTNRRALIGAQIEGNKNVFCTHLTADLSDTIPYVGSWGSWEDENYLQTQKISEFLDSNAGENTTLLMGDFNFGPGIKSARIRGAFERSYHSLVETGFLDVFNIQDIKCSFCPGENTLIKVGTQQVDSVEGYLIDHIFVDLRPGRSLPGPFFYQRSLVQKLDLGYELSDHYAVRVDFQDLEE